MKQPFFVHRFLQLRLIKNHSIKYSSLRIKQITTSLIRIMYKRFVKKSTSTIKNIRF